MAGTSPLSSLADPGAALVTGSGARLGKAMAEALGARGWAVAVHYRGSKTGAEVTCQRIEEAGGRAALVQADLGTEAGRDGVVARAADALDAPLDLLVNSASTFVHDTAEGHTRQDWDFHMEANLRAPVHLAQQFVAAQPSGRKGLIVNMIDQRVWKLNPQFFTYTLSKAALLQATKTLAQALAPDIRVNAIGPGPTLRSVHQSEAEFAEEARHTLTQEGSHPDEIVKALLFFVDTPSVTGQMIAADGGQQLMWQTPDVMGPNG